MDCSLIKGTTKNSDFDKAFSPESRTHRSRYRITLTPTFHSPFNYSAPVVANWLGDANYIKSFGNSTISPEDETAAEFVQNNVKQQLPDGFVGLRDPTGMRVTDP